MERSEYPGTHPYWKLVIPKSKHLVSRICMLLCEQNATKDLKIVQEHDDIVERIPQQQ